MIEEEVIVDLTSSSKYHYHLKEKQGDGSYIITGWYPPQFKAGASMLLNVGDHYMVEKVKFRDHKGVFSDPKMAKKSFFKALAVKLLWDVAFNQGYRVTVSALTQDEAENRAYVILRKAKKSDAMIKDVKISEIFKRTT